MMTLKEYRELNDMQNTLVTCDFGCDFETASGNDERILDSWENAIVDEAYEIDGRNYVDCHIEIIDD